MSRIRFLSYSRLFSKYSVYIRLYSKTNDKNTPKIATNSQSKNNKTGKNPDDREFKVLKDCKDQDQIANNKAEKCLEAQIRSHLNIECQTFRRSCPYTPHMIILEEEKSIKKPAKDTIKKDETTTADTKSSGGNGGGSKKMSVLKRRDPAKVIMGFIPIEWFEFFLPKTGVTGLYTLFTTFSTFLVSKELFVLEHNFYNGISMALLCVLTVKYLGPATAKFLDEKIDEYEKELNEDRDKAMKDLKDAIKAEDELQKSMNAQLVLVDAKRENVALQLEAEFRSRQMEVYQQIKNRLDYAIAEKEIIDRYIYRNRNEWVISQVKHSLSPDLREQFLYMSVYEWIDIIKANKNVA